MMAGHLSRCAGPFLVGDRGSGNIPRAGRLIGETAARRTLPRKDREMIPSTRFQLSFAQIDETRDFDSAADAGRAFAAARADLNPRIILSNGRSARTIARCVRIGDEIQKSAPALESVMPCDLDFWTAYHEGRAA